MAAAKEPPMCRHARTLLTTFLVLAVCESSARAQDPPSHWGRLFPSLFLTSDYRYEGQSLNGHRAAVQASLYWWRPDNFYAGVWMSPVDFSDLGDPTTSFEVDVYGGRNLYVGRTELTFEGMYSFFPDKNIPGPTYDFVTTKVRLRRSLGALTLGSAFGLVPDAPYDGGPAWRITEEFSYRWAAWLKTGGRVGRRWSARTVDRTFWDIGATTSWKQVSVDLRLSDTNLGVTECGGVNWCEPGVVATLQVDLWK
jgi:uncharacterized protein (TIGR02001 family)